MHRSNLRLPAGRSLKRTPVGLAKGAALCVTLVTLAACATSPERMGLPAGSPVRLGSTVAQTQQALGVNTEPARGGVMSELILPLDARGIQVFFDKQDKVRTVRLRAPYAQPVMGIRIGDPGADVLAKMGKPAAQARAEGQTGYTYHPDEITLLTYVVGGDGKVETIFVVR
jgi:hypothetical protein